MAIQRFAKGFQQAFKLLKLLKIIAFPILPTDFIASNKIKNYKLYRFMCFLSIAITSSNAFLREVIESVRITPYSVLRHVLSTNAAHTVQQPRRRINSL